MSNTSFEQINFQSGNNNPHPPANAPLFEGKPTIAATAEGSWLLSTAHLSVVALLRSLFRGGSDRFLFRPFYSIPFVVFPFSMYIFDYRSIIRRTERRAGISSSVHFLLAFNGVSFFIHLSRLPEYYTTHRHSLRPRKIVRFRRPCHLSIGVKWESVRAGRFRLISGRN